MNIKEGQRVGAVGKLAMAGVVAFGAGAAMHEINSGDNAAEANANAATADLADYEPASARVIKCKAKNRWYPLKEGEQVTLRANSAIVPADVTVDGRRQYDDDADTSTVVGLRSKSKAGYSRTWNLDADYAGSMLVQKCKTSKKQFYQALGRNITVLERRTGVKNNVKRVNTNVIEK